ncbi:hypothetical protein Fot_42424 [Forsythia ovata]|uniref:Uncharacterized protein n=1 Tax=Forsythia ovata TaxID=205694 RepID=A0ABD1RL59_9LAMI
MFLLLFFKKLVSLKFGFVKLIGHHYSCPIYHSCSVWTSLSTPDYLQGSPDELKASLKCHYVRSIRDQFNDGKTYNRRSSGSSKKEGRKGNQLKRKGIAKTSGAVSSGEGGHISPRINRVNLGLTPEEIDLEEGWVEHIRELSRGHEDPDTKISEESSHFLVYEFGQIAVGDLASMAEVSPDYPMTLYVFHTLFKLNKCA